MATELWQVVVGGVLGGVAAPYLTSARDRREARARVAEALGHLEQQRWAFNGSQEDFRTALTAFTGAALVAGLPRGVVERHEHFAGVARWLSQQDYESQPDSHFAGAVPSRVADLVKAHLVLVRRHVWSPWRARLGYRRAVRDLARAEAAVRAEMREDDVPDWIWTWTWA